MTGISHDISKWTTNEDWQANPDAGVTYHCDGKVAVIDNFLREELFLSLHRYAREGALYTRIRRAKSMYRIDQQQWDDLSEDERSRLEPELWSARHYDAGCRPGWERRDEHLLNILFSNVLRQQSSQALFARITGTPLTGALYNSLVGMKQGDFLLKHDDHHSSNEPDIARRLAYIFYLTEGWRPDFGGRLQVYDPNHSDRITASIEPLPNRLALLTLSPGFGHSVEELTAACGEWVRYIYVGWMN